MNPIPLPRGANAVSPTAPTGILKTCRSFLTAEDVVATTAACGVVDSASAPASAPSVARRRRARRSLVDAIVWASRSPDVLVGTERAGNRQQQSIIFVSARRLTTPCEDDWPFAPIFARIAFRPAQFVSLGRCKFAARCILYLLAAFSFGTLLFVKTGVKTA